jgi:aspartate-semialdehyde dehydrogenase
MERIPVAILGATGMVGQRLIQRLANHPQFKVVAVAASERSAGKVYQDATVWRLPGEPYGDVADLMVSQCVVSEMPEGVKLAFSALDDGPAQSIEAAFREAGWAVVSNASTYREDPLVPLIIPEINPEHLSMLEAQPGPGFILTNPNCSAIPLAMSLAPLDEAFGVEAVVASTWQAVSGAGYPGESAWDMVGNVHPHPGNEEAKMAIEPQKILGPVGEPAAFALSARCVRVPVADGHLVSAQVRLRTKASPTQVREAIEGFVSRCPELPSSPTPLFRIFEARDRPTPRMDADLGEGMAISIGRIEHCPVMGIKFFCLAHNTVRGAAGAAIANAELLLASGHLK